METQFQILILHNMDGRRMNGQLDEWMDVEGWKDGRIEGWVDGRMEEWMNRRMGGWKDGRMDE